MHMNTSTQQRHVDAGYMQNAYYDDQWNLTKNDLKFGTRTREKTLSNIHDHLTSWKIDLDINGTRNNFHKTVSSTLSLTARKALVACQTVTLRMVAARAFCINLYDMTGDHS